MRLFFPENSGGDRERRQRSSVLPAALEEKTVHRLAEETPGLTQHYQTADG